MLSCFVTADLRKSCDFNVCEVTRPIGISGCRMIVPSGYVQCNGRYDGMCRLNGWCCVQVLTPNAVVIKSTSGCRC